MKPETVALGEACIVVMGQSPPGTSYNTSGDGLPFFQGKTDFGETYPKVRVFCNQPSRIAEEGDILMSVRAPVGPTNLAKERCCIGRGLAALRTGTRLDTSFLLYFLRHHEPRLASQGQGSTFDAINRDDLEEIEIPLPGLPEQRRIAGRLEQSDRLRRTRRYALELTDTFLPAAFLELFGDPAENPRAFDRVQVEGLFAHSRDGAKCGPFGSALKKHEYVAAGIPVWTMNNVGANQFVEAGCLYITPQKFEELAAYNAQNGDILVSRAGTVGRMAIVRTTHPRSIIHSNIIRLSLNHAKILPIYFVGLMTWFAPRVARLKRGQEDAYTFMSMGSLGELQIPLPPFPLQQKFAALVQRVDRLRAVQREALRQAEHLFASLLHRAFSG